MSALSTFMNEIRLLSHQMFGEAGGKILAEAIRKGGTGGVEVAIENVKKVIQQNPRAEVVLALMSIGVEDLRKLLVIHKDALKDHRENRFVVALGAMLPRKEDGRVDEERAERIYQQLASELSRAEIEQLLEMLVHDPIAQWFRYWTQGEGKEDLRELAARGLEGAAWLWGLTLHSLDVPRRLTDAATALDESDREFNRRSWWRKMLDIKAR